MRNLRLTTYRGDSRTLRIPTEWAGAPFVPDANWPAIFSLKDSIADPDEDAHAQKATGAGISLVSAQAALDVALVPVDTLDLPTGRAFEWDIQVQHTGTGEVRTIARGTLTLIGDATIGTTTSIPIFTTQPPAPIAAALYREAVAEVADADDETIAVVFASALAAAPSGIHVASAGPVPARWLVGSETTTGFTITLSGPAPAGMKVTYRTFP